MKIGDAVEVPAETNGYWQGVGIVASDPYTGYHNEPVVNVGMQTGKMAGSTGGFPVAGLKVIPPVDETVSYLRAQAKFLETAADLIERRFDHR